MKRVSAILTATTLLTSSLAFAGTSKTLNVPLIGQQVNWWCWAAAGQMIFDYLGAKEMSQCAEANHEFKRNDCCGSGACTMDSDCIPANAPSCSTNNDCIPSDAPSCGTDADCPNNEWCFEKKCSDRLCRAGKCTTEVCGDQCMPATCNRGGGTEFTPWDFQDTPTTCNTLLTYAQFKAEIDANRPVEFAWSAACTTADHTGCYQLCGNWVTGGHVLAAVGYQDNGPSSQMVVINDPWPPKVGTRYMLSYDDWVKQPTNNPDPSCPNSIGCESHYTQLHVYNIHDDQFCHADNFGLPASDFQHCFDYQALRGRHAVAASFMEDGNFTSAASFQSVASQPVRDRMSYDVWSTELTEKKAKGYRPASVSVVVSGGTPLVTSIWTPAKGATFHSYCAQSAADLVSKDNAYFAQGFIMHDLFAYSPISSGSDATNFCATWVQEPGYYEFYYDMTADSYNAMFQQKSSTLVPIRFSAYDTATRGRRYAVLWHKATNAWVQWYDMTPTFYQSQHDTLINKGFVESAVTSLDGHYSVLWTKP